MLWRRHNCIILAFLIFATFILAFIIQFDHPCSPLFLKRSVPRSVRSLKNSVVYSNEAALNLPKKGRVLCFVISSDKHTDSRIPAVVETWLPRCDHGQIFTHSAILNDKIPHSTVFETVADKYDNLFYKSLMALHYAYYNISDEFDWYFKADDDTYVIMEHLYEYLETLDPSQKFFLGYRMKPYLRNGYNGGGAGYVLSRAAMKAFIDSAFENQTLCPDDTNEDVGVARCLQNIGIYPHDTRNEQKQQRFNTYRPDFVFNGVIANRWHFYPQILGHMWASPDLITIHHIKPDEMRMIDDLLYRVKSPTQSKHYKPQNT